MPFQISHSTTHPRLSIELFSNPASTMNPSSDHCLQVPQPARLFLAFWHRLLLNLMFQEIGKIRAVFFGEVLGIPDHLEKAPDYLAPGLSPRSRRALLPPHSPWQSFENIPPQGCRYRRLKINCHNSAACQRPILQTMRYWAHHDIQGLAENLRGPSSKTLSCA